MESKQALYEQLISEMRSCKRCDLGQELNEGLDPHVVGAGSLDARVIFVAEAPGKQEVLHGRCLTPPGKSGVVYEKCLSMLGLTRDQVYTTNTVCCRPPNNRDPEAYECLKCRPFLERQIQLIQPKLVVSFGRFAAQSFLLDFKITRDHGKLLYSKTYNTQVFPLYHPAYIACYSPKSKREEFKQDLLTLKRLILEDR